MTPAGSLVIGIPDVIVARMRLSQLQSVDTKVHFGRESWVCEIVAATRFHRSAFHSPCLHQHHPDG